MKRLILIILFAVLSTALFAEDGYVIVYNRTGYDIYEMYVSHGTADDWEDDVLGEYILKDDESFEVTLDGYKTLVFDVMAVDEDGDTYYFWNLDAALNDFSLTIDYLE